jgi:hypothetical protein
MTGTAADGLPIMAATTVVVVAATTAAEAVAVAVFWSVHC